MKAIGLKFEEVNLSPPLCIFFLVFSFFSSFFFYFLPLSILIYIFFFLFFVLFKFFAYLLVFYAFFASCFFIICSWATTSFSFFFVVGQLSSPIVNIFTCYGHLERYALSFFLGFDFLFDPFLYL